MPTSSDATPARAIAVGSQERQRARLKVGFNAAAHEVDQKAGERICPVAIT